MQVVIYLHPNIISTSSTTKTITWVETTSGTRSASANTFIITDGLSVSEVGSILILQLITLSIRSQVFFPTTDNTNFIEDKELKYKAFLKPDNTIKIYANATHQVVV